MKHPILFFAAFLFISFQVFAGGFDSNPQQYLGFIENNGQVHDQSGNTRSDVKFVFEKNEFKLILKKTGFSIEFTKTTPSGNFPESGVFENEEADDEYADVPFQQVITRVDVSLKNCNPNSEIAGENSFSSYLNYFNQYTGPAGITHVRSFGRVVYKNIYNNIDLVFYLEEKNKQHIPHYEFVVNAGGNMKDIQLAYSGQEKLSITKDGQLEFTTQQGWATSSSPKIISSDRKFLSECSFILRGSNISFSKFKSGTNSSFIIDPEIDWGTYYGGTGKDLTDEISCDHEGNVYLTGRTGSADQVATIGSYQTTLGGMTDVPLIKFDGDGNLLWATYYGGEGNDVAFAITTDPFNNAWIGGRTASYHGIATSNCIDSTFSGGYFDMLVGKFSPAGMLLFGTYMGDTLKDEVQEMNTDPAGDIYVSGYSESNYVMATAGAWNQLGDTAGDAFLLKFNNEAKLLWGTYLGGEGRDRGHGIAIDPRGHIYQFGTTDSKHNLATAGVYQDQLAGLNDCFLAKWREDNGQLLWCTYWGGEGDERGRDIRVDMSGNIYGVGQTESETGIATAGVWKDTLHYLPNYDRDGFLVKFDSTGNRLWGTYFGGNNIDMPRSLQVTPDGSVLYVGGYTRSDSFFSTHGAYNVRRGGGNDAFFLMMNWNATKLLYSTYYGGKNSESITEGGWYGPTIDRDDNGNIFISSGTTSPDSIATPNGYKTTINDTTQYDFFVAKFSDPCTDGYEPQNDSMDTAPPLVYNAKTHTFDYSATIDNKLDKDYFSFVKSPKFDDIKATLTNLPFDCNLFIYDENKNLIGKSSNTGLANESIFIHETYSSKYYVLVKSPTHEFSDFNCYKLKILVSVETKQSLDQPSSFNAIIYPNPAADESTLSFESSINQTGVIEIFDITGQKLSSSTIAFSAGSNSASLPVKSLAAGNYLVKIHSETGDQVLKLMVQHE